MAHQQPVTMPQAPRRPTVHEAHGVRREDDYAWLHDIAAPQSAGYLQAVAYLQAERDFYDQAVARLGPLTERLAEEFTARTPVFGTSPRWRRGGLDFFTLAGPEEGGERPFVVQPAGDGQGRAGGERLLFDPHRIAPEAPYLDLGVVEPSPDGRALAYSVDLTGDEVFELRFRDVASGRDLPDRVPRCCRGGGFSADGSMFFYAVPGETGGVGETGGAAGAQGGALAGRVLRHRLGTPVADDVAVAVEADRRFEFTVHGSRDGGWIVIRSASRDTSQVELVDARHPEELPRLVAAARPGIGYDVEPMPGGWAGDGEDLLLVVTDDGAPEFRLMTAPVPQPGRVGDPADWRVVPRAVASDGSERLEEVCLLRRHLVLSLRGDGEPFLRVLGRGPGTAVGERAMREIHAGLPCGQVRLWHAQDPSATQVTVVEQNLVTAPRWIDVDLTTGERSVLARTEVPGVDPTRYVTERLDATGADGVRVPVTIARPAELEPGKSAGALLEGFGAYETCSWPRFSVSTLSLLDRGLVIAVAHVRGGGELGRRWWQAGRLRAKQNTFDDFVAARDALVAAGWAGEDGVVSRGRSAGGLLQGAGGLLQGAVFSQAPQRFAAVVAEMPFVDVVTALSDPSLPPPAWERDEWGDPVTDPEAFAAMLAWSPYDNPPPSGKRSPLLVTGALDAPRALVTGPAKWVARLRATDELEAPAPLLFRVGLGPEPRAGAVGRIGQLRYEAEILSWMLDRLGLAGEATGLPSTGAPRPVGCGLSPRRPGTVP
jgi:oligopeptidase B